jgi:hypothetical protein
VAEGSGRWAFFLHCVDLARPLETPVGPRTIPTPSPCPKHLRHLRYEAP